MTIIVPDLHGELGLLDQVLGAYPDREFVFLGDLIDRGPNSPGVVARVINLVDSGQARLCKGNHEDMMIKGVKYQSLDNFTCWMQHGGDAATSQYESMPQGTFTHHVDWLEHNSYEWITIDTPDGKVLCSHASRPNTPYVVANPSLRDPGRTIILPDDHLWTSARRYTPLLPDGYGYSVHGHIPQVRPRPEPRFFPGTMPYWMLDIGSCFNGHLAVLDTLSGNTTIFKN